MDAYKEEMQFENSDSGASLTYPQRCSALRKGGHVLLKGNPCKIIEMSRSQPGKHGHAKIHLVGLDIFTGKKYEDICPSHHSMKVPNVTRLDYEVTDMLDGYVALMDDNGKMWGMKLDENSSEQLTKYDLENDLLKVTVLKAMAKEKIVSVKRDAGAGCRE